MDFTEDLRRNSVTWVLYHKWAFANQASPLISELNTTDEFLKLDITCALDEETTTLTLGSSDLDERLSFCDGIGKSRPTGVSAEAALGVYRDADRNADGLFNETLNWLKHEDFDFYLVQRVGPQDSGPTGTGAGQLAKPFETTDVIRMGRFRLDYPIDTLADGDPALLTVTPLEAGFLAWNINPSA